MGQQRRRQVASPTGGMLRCVITEVFASVTSDAKRLALCGLQHRGVTEGAARTHVVTSPKRCDSDTTTNCRWFNRLISRTCSSVEPLNFSGNMKKAPQGRLSH